MTEAGNRFALRLYGEIAKSQGSTNIFFSPWIVSSIFALVYEGARGETAEQLQTVFGFVRDKVERATLFRAFFERLNRNDQSYDLHIANALWIAESYERMMDHEYVDTAKKVYEAEIRNVDFSNRHTVDEINHWVESKTNNKIRKIISHRMINDWTRLILTNAIYFKGAWKIAFKEELTADTNYWIEPQKPVKVRMMTNIAQFSYAESDELQLIELPYEGSEISMLIMLPRDNVSLHELEESQIERKLGDLVQKLRVTKVRVFLPKFKFETFYPLNGYLISMGLELPFDRYGANFTGMTKEDIPKEEELFVDFVAHKAFVSVDEMGTEAAASTVVFLTGRGSTAPRIPVFNANKPFIFMIRDVGDGGILFLGRVIDPRPKDDD